MSKKILEADTEKELDKLICREKLFASVLSHATQMYEHILDEVGADQEAIDGATVTLGADFAIDTFDLLIEYALRYEGEVFSDVHDQLLEQYKMMSRTKSGFGSKTVH